MTRKLGQRCFSHVTLFLWSLGQRPHDTRPPTPVQPENNLQHSSEDDELEVGPPLSVSSEYEGDSSTDDLSVVGSDSGRTSNTSHDKYFTNTSSSSDGHSIRRDASMYERWSYPPTHHFKNKLPLPEWEWKSNFLRVIKPFLRIPIIRYYGW